MHKVRTNPPRSKEPYPTIPLHPSIHECQHISWHGIQMQWNDSTPCVDAAPVWWTVKINTQVNLQTWSLQYRAWCGWSGVVGLDGLDFLILEMTWILTLSLVRLNRKKESGWRVHLEDPFHYMRCQPVVVSLSKWVSPIEWREEGNEAREEEPLPSSLLAYILHKYSRCRKHTRPWTARLSDALWNSLSVLFCSRVLKNRVSLLFSLGMHRWMRDWTKSCATWIVHMELNIIQNGKWHALNWNMATLENISSFEIQ